MAEEGAAAATESQVGRGDGAGRVRLLSVDRVALPRGGGAAAVLRRHLADGMLAASSVAVCLGGAQEAMALRELGVVGAVAVARKRSPPLAVAGNDRRLPFLDSSVDFVFAGAPSTTRRPASAHKSVANEQDQWARTHGVEKKEGGRGIDGHF